MITLTALRLSVEHRARVDRVTLPSPPPRPLIALEQALGSSLPAPCGSRDRRDFVFLVGRDPPAGAVRLADLPDDAWSLYVETMLGGWQPPTRAVDVFHFGNEPLMAANLAHLVKCGRKRATFGWVRACELEGVLIPSAGLVSIVVDGYGYPQCAIRTLEVRRLPMRDVDADLAAEEAEGDLTLEDWREGHLTFFTSEAARLNLRFTPDEELFVERFQLIATFPEKGITLD